MPIEFSLNPMPYPGACIEVIQRGSYAQVGDYSLDTATETRVFDVPFSARKSFLDSMVGHASLPDDALMIATHASVQGFGDGPVLPPGSGEYATARITLTYTPVELPDPDNPESSPVGVKYTEVTDYTIDVVAIPTTLWYIAKLLGGNNPVWRPVPDGYVGVNVAVTRRVYTFDGLTTFNESAARAVFGKIDAAKEYIRLSTLQANTSHKVNGDRSYSLTVGIDVRDGPSWNQFIIGERSIGGARFWDWYYINPDSGIPFIPYESGAVVSFLSSLGVRNFGL